MGAYKTCTRPLTREVSGLGKPGIVTEIRVRVWGFQGTTKSTLRRIDASLDPPGVHPRAAPGGLLTCFPKPHNIKSKMPPREGGWKQGRNIKRNGDLDK